MAKKIMVVDDEPDVRMTIKSILEKQGYDVSSARSGDECLKKLKKERPDLILMDIMMPGTPVKDVVSQIKGTKIVFISVIRKAEAEKESLLKSKNVVGFIEKPFDVKEVIRKVRTIL